MMMVQAMAQPLAGRDVFVIRNSAASAVSVVGMSGVSVAVL